MRTTQTYTLGPGYWWPLGSLTNVEMLQVRNGKGLRLMFTDALISPDDDDEEPKSYISTVPYDPHPIVLDPSRAKSAAEFLYAWVEGDQSAEVTVVYNAATSISPPGGLLPDGKVGQAYTRAFTVPGSTGSTTFSTSDTLPSGLTLSAAGILSGTPSKAGVYYLTLRATPSSGPIAYAVYSLLIVA
ncbi:putative Ig domain-containing protein [Rhizobium sp. PP-F2F-G48]|uniref:Ig domain-containing protein n=1 Tax=Rhizobium sp. PP-F2F-G48 TaxID=2135651 RepID=UPI00104B62A0|nr:Ig domain-containing protein [Rhizobium sp. PP-F2F-G48]TCM57831.1 putative Ig domain-containing protein [Rhizobium sp. PP-F2F-G48]